MTITKHQLTHQIQQTSTKILAAIESSSHSEVIEKLEQYNLQLNSILTNIEILENEESNETQIQVILTLYSFHFFFLILFSSLLLSFSSYFSSSFLLIFLFFLFSYFE